MTEDFYIFIILERNKIFSSLLTYVPCEDVGESGEDRGDLVNGADVEVARDPEEDQTRLILG